MSTLFPPPILVSDEWEVVTDFGSLEETESAAKGRPHVIFFDWNRTNRWYLQLKKAKKDRELVVHTSLVSQ